MAGRCATLRVHNGEGADVVYLPEAMHEEGEIEVWYNGRNHYEAVRRATIAAQRKKTDSALAISKNKKRPLNEDPKITKRVIREHGTEHSFVDSSIVEVMHTIIDMGEGWGGTRRAVEATEEGARSVGVDRRGFTALGKDLQLDQIIARISVDFAEPTKAQNLLRKIAAKGRRALHTYLMTWLSPECTLFSQANWMNVTRGCAHGAATLDPRNMSRSTPERQAEEADLVQEAKKALVAQLQALAEEPISSQHPVGPARGHNDHRGAADLDKARSGSVCVWAGRAETLDSHDQLSLAANGTDMNRKMH